MATITHDHQWRQHKGATQRNIISRVFLLSSMMLLYIHLFFPFNLKAAAGKMSSLPEVALGRRAGT